MEQQDQYPQSVPCPPELEKRWYEALDEHGRWSFRFFLGGGLMAAVASVLMLTTTSIPGAHESGMAIGLIAAVLLFLALFIASTAFTRIRKWFTRPPVCVFAVDEELVYLWPKDVDDRRHTGHGCRYETSDHTMQMIESAICVLPTGFRGKGTTYILDCPVTRWRMSAPGRNPWRAIRVLDHQGDRATYDMTLPGIQSLLADKLQRIRSHSSLVDMEFMDRLTSNTLGKYALELVTQTMACANLIEMSKSERRSHLMGLLNTTLTKATMQLAHWFRGEQLDVHTMALSQHLMSTYEQIKFDARQRNNAGPQQHSPGFGQDGSARI